jgi:hypothetical protein
MGRTSRMFVKDEKRIHLAENPKKTEPTCPCALTEHHAMKVYWGSGSIDPRIPDLGTRWK